MYVLNLLCVYKFFIVNCMWKALDVVSQFNLTLTSFFLKTSLKISHWKSGWKSPSRLLSTNLYRPLFPTTLGPLTAWICRDYICKIVILFTISFRILDQSQAWFWSSNEKEFVIESVEGIADEPIVGLKREFGLWSDI